jgi:hypothetical protein
LCTRQKVVCYRCQARTDQLVFLQINCFLLYFISCFVRILMLIFFKSDTSHNKGTLASLIRHHYEKILYPFDMFVQGVLANSSSGVFDESISECTSETDQPVDKKLKLDIVDDHESESKTVGELRNESKPLRVSPRRLSRRLNNCQENNLNSSNKEQQRIQAFNSKIMQANLDSNSSQANLELSENPVSQL